MHCGVGADESKRGRRRAQADPARRLSPVTRPLGSAWCRRGTPGRGSPPRPWLQQRGVEAREFRGNCEQLFWEGRAMRILNTERACVSVSVSSARACVHVVWMRETRGESGCSPTPLFVFPAVGALMNSSCVSVYTQHVRARVYVGACKRHREGEDNQKQVSHSSSIPPLSPSLSSGRSAYGQQGRERIGSPASCPASSFIR